MLRVLAMVNVVFMHAMSLPLRTKPLNSVWFLFTVLTSFAFTAVPCFFMMSGALLLCRPGEAEFGAFYRKHLPRVILPLLVWSLISLAGPMEYQSVGDVTEAFLQTLKEPAIVPLWFLYTLIPLYLLAPFLKVMLDHLPEKGRLWLLGLIVVIDVWATLPGELGKYLIINAASQMFLFRGYFGFFLLGALLFTIRRRVPKKYLLLLAGVLVAVISVGTWFLSVRAGEYDSTLQGQNKPLIGTLGALLLLLFLEMPKPKHLGEAMSALAQLSFGVYLAHGFFLQKIVSVGKFGGWRLGLARFGLSLMLSIMVTFLFASIRPLCFLFTGMTYETACRSCNLKWILSRRRKGNSAEDGRS